MSETPMPLPTPFAVAPGQADAAPAAAETGQAAANKITVSHLDFFYGQHQALFENNLEIAPRSVTAIIGPSGCGKSTHLRVYNRIFELYPDQRAAGEILLDGENILSPATDIIELRRKVGMIFQRPTVFPRSVFENVAYGLRIHYKLKPGGIAERVE